MTLEPGTQFGEYEVVVGLIGQGGMGEVRTVALKIIAPRSATPGASRGSAAKRSCSRR